MGLIPTGAVSANSARKSNDFSTNSPVPHGTLFLGTSRLSPTDCQLPSLGSALEITYLGHSAFRLRGKDVTIVTDPYPPTVGIAMGKAQADIVTVSHHSQNHSFVSGVGGNPRAITGPGEYEIKDVLIAGVATASEPKVGPTNTAYVLRFDDLAVCHLGDIDTKLSNQQVEELGSIDILLIPVGGGATLGPGEAAEVVSQLEPSLVVPMHYKLPGLKVNGLQPVDHFCREMGTKDFVPESKLTVSRGSLAPEIKLVVLEHRRV
jgi:L-ascorbate metabolism protein UlaG (beta-lactamase superfamily)